jgi:branched-chain amino acid transport system ATP-binding protein
VSAMLEVKDLVVSYGKIKAVKGISFDVEQGSVVSLIGTNGAGKTTTLRTISGLLRPTSGSITFEGKDITKVAAHDIVSLGLAHSPEGRRIFPQLTVRENLMLGAFSRKDKDFDGDLAEIYELFPILEERNNQPAGTFSGGEQQMLAMGRAMMSRPKLLMLDEPSMGLSPIMVDKIFEVVRDVYAQGVTVVLVEQNASRALAIADRGYVMDSGLITMTGDAKQMLSDPKVRAAYLGE